MIGSVIVAEVSRGASRSGRALFLAADLPWPRDGGGRIGTLHLLEAMCRLYEVDLVAMADSQGEPDLDYLRSICASVEVVPIPFTFGRHRVRQSFVFGRGLFSREPYRIRKFRSGRFERAVRRRFAAGRYDLLHCDSLGTVPYARLAPPDLPATMAHHNMESDIYRLAAQQATNPLRRLLASVEERKLRRAEATLLPTFDRTFVVAPEDAELLHRLGVERTTVLPMPAPSLSAARQAPPAGRRILSLGSMSWYGVADGLLWFHDQVLPLVRERVPDVEWELVGPYAPVSIRRLDGEAGIRVAGYVRELLPHVASARVAIVPLRIAGGVRIKLLDCLAWGLPAVATSVGARGLEFPDGSGCFREDDPAALAERVVALLTDDRLWLSTAEAGRRFVTEHHSAARFDGAVESGIQAAVEHRGQRGSSDAI
jgi:glycosyltransferase involved in cell wall biosynthesis